jgi:hypothetical protein
VDDTFPPETFEDGLNLEKLENLLMLLKESEVSHFRFGILEIGFDAPAAEPASPMGFVPIGERIGELAKTDDGDVEDSKVPAHYRKAFSGRKVPTFKPKG